MRINAAFEGKKNIEIENIARGKPEPACICLLPPYIKATLHDVFCRRVSGRVLVGNSNSCAYALSCGNTTTHCPKAPRPASVGWVTPAIRSPLTRDNATPTHNCSLGYCAGLSYQEEKE
ncbi:hypothetical protein E2C01_057175 [Portunus trituberculatus]|uniref:Uncharacterized protein n=1 Tax=Portunus trituberculatus TaxID=210409 RepID=A0A5B7GW38_PORTR|nr:hypothetical protein [Portunus trituberculatus]